MRFKKLTQREFYRVTQRILKYLKTECPDGTATADELFEKFRVVETAELERLCMNGILVYLGRKFGGVGPKVYANARTRR